MLYSLDDIVLIPEVLSAINHRAECNVTSSLGNLPLFTAPMSCVIDDKNYTKFSDVGINTIIPRNIPIERRMELVTSTFVAMSFNEFYDHYINDNTTIEGTHYVCVDVANGHMLQLYEASKVAKSIHGDHLVLMIGNIANPKTYLEYANIGVDYVRLGIGSGNVCTTSANTAIHYPIASLITECVDLKEYSLVDTKIVADGGFKNFDQIIKALALGADYVMLGQILAKSEEACGKIVNPNSDYGFYREYYGMSTKRAQKEFGKEGNTTAEGIIKHVEVEYPIAKWVDNFKHYLRSAMSYTDSYNLQEFKDTKYEIISPAAHMAYYK